LGFDESREVEGADRPRHPAEKEPRTLVYRRVLHDNFKNSTTQPAFLVRSCVSKPSRLIVLCYDLSLIHIVGTGLDLHIQPKATRLISHAYN
jgi:hypothetical protein